MSISGAAIGENFVNMTIFRSNEYKQVYCIHCYTYCYFSLCCSQWRCLCPATVPAPARGPWRVASPLTPTSPSSAWLSPTTRRRRSPSERSSTTSPTASLTTPATPSGTAPSGTTSHSTTASSSALAAKGTKDTRGPSTPPSRTCSIRAASYVVVIATRRAPPSGSSPVYERLRPRSPQQLRMTLLSLRSRTSLHHWLRVESARPLDAQTPPAVSEVLSHALSRWPRQLRPTTRPFRRRPPRHAYRFPHLCRRALLERPPL